MTRFLPSLVLLSAACPLLWAQEPDFRELNARYRRAAEADAVQALETFLPRFQAGARAHRDEASAGPFLVWILENAGLQAEAVEPALQALVEGPADEDSLVAAARALPYLYAVLGLDAVDGAAERLADSPSTRVRAEALYARAVLQTTEWGSRSEERQREAFRELQAAAEALDDPDLDARVSALRPRPRDLEVGELAPEILGLDMEGNPFRLSDYRGKVVVLDFWGDW